MQKRILIVLCLSIPVCSSCKEKDSAQPENTIIGSNFTRIQACIDQSKFVYHDRLEPATLNGLQIENISRYVTERGMSINRVWFVRVLYSDDRVLTVDIYFRPTIHSARLMTGQHLYYSSTYELLAEKSEPPAWLQSISAKSELIGLLTAELPVYVYVPDRQLKNSERMAVPDGLFFPFEWPDGFSDQEILEIVDFVRSGPLIKHSDEQGYTIRYPDKVDLALPIKSIRRANDHIKVETGTQEGPLAGCGQSLQIRKTGDGYELLSISMWLS